MRKKIAGSADRPRMSVFKSNRYTYVQVIDDSSGTTLCAVSNSSKENASIKNTVEGVGKLGEIIAGQLKDLKITSVVFDRNGYAYHGIVRAVADGTRKAGIRF